MVSELLHRENGGSEEMERERRYFQEEGIRRNFKWIGRQAWQYCHEAEEDKPGKRWT